MGYQIIRNSSDIFVIYNATVAIPLDELRARKFSIAEYGFLSEQSTVARNRQMRVLDLDQQFELAFSTLEPIYASEASGLNLNFSEAVISTPDKLMRPRTARAYYRFSAFNVDRRIDSGTGDFFPGTYATTFSDIHHVPSGFAAVGRYALPNPASARYVYQIITADRPSLIGTAAPNFGQAGGGVEVLFKRRARLVFATPFVVATS